MCYIGEYFRTVVVEPLEVPTLTHIARPEETEQPDQEQPDQVPVEQPDQMPVPAKQ
jgi:hypothetical protein